MFTTSRQVIYKKTSDSVVTLVADVKIHVNESFLFLSSEKQNYKVKLYLHKKHDFFINLREESCIKPMSSYQLQYMSLFSSSQHYVLHYVIEKSRTHTQFKINVAKWDCSCFKPLRKKDQ